MMPLQRIEEMFSHMRAETTWNIEGEMLWGYFFTDPDPNKLEHAAQFLVQSGYRFVNLDETVDRSTYILHVERVEKHTPESLYARNAEFYRLADDYGLRSYDGMDVGPVIEGQARAKKIS